MPTYLYGLILPRNTSRVPAGVTGIGGGVLRRVDCGRVVAIVSDVETVPATNDVASVRAHDAALRALAGAGITVAAVRFGQSFAAESDLCAQLAARTTALATQLAALDGCVEMRLLLPMDAVPMTSKPQPKGTGPGRSYLEGLRHSVHVTGVTLRETLGPVVLDERVEVLGGRDGMSFAHLVRIAEVDAYKSQVARLPILGQGIVLGPLPLYSFAPEING